MKYADVRGAVYFFRSLLLFSQQNTSSSSSDVVVGPNVCVLFETFVSCPIFLLGHL